MGKFFIMTLDLVQFLKHSNPSAAGRRSFLTTQHFFDVFFDLDPGQHDLSSAALAADLEIHAHTQYIKPICTAGMLFFGLDHIADLYIHDAPPFPAA